MKQPEYTEGPEALENFKKMAVAIFQSPKAGGRKRRKKSKQTCWWSARPKNSDRDRAAIRSRNRMTHDVEQ